MRASRITFKFERREFDRHLLDAPGHLTDKTALRQFLAKHTHFYMTGMVPKGSGLTNGPGYRIFNADHNGIEILERSAPTAGIAIQDP